MALDASSRLFYYDARYDPLRAVGGPDAVFSRNGGATEFDGSLFRPRIVNQPIVSPSVDGDGVPRQHVMVQPAILPQIEESTSFAAGAGWTHAAGISDSDPANSVIQGQEARRLAQNGGATPNMFRDVGVFTSGTEILHDCVEQGDNSTHYVGVWSLLASDWVIRASLNLSGGANTIVNGAGAIHAQELLGVGPNGGRLWEFFLRYTGAGPSAGRRVYWYPTTSGPNPGYAFCHYVNIYEGAHASTPIVGDTPQAKDIMWFPLGWVPQPHAGVLEFIQGEVDLAANQNFHLTLGNGTSRARVHIFTDHGSSLLRVFEESQVVETRGAELNAYTAVPGSRVRVVWRSTASDLYAAFYVDGASLGTDSNTTDLTYDAWPADPHITFGAIDKNMSLPARTGIQRLAIVKEADLDAAAGLSQDAIDELVGYHLTPDGRLVA